MQCNSCQSLCKTLQLRALVPDALLDNKLTVGYVDSK